MEVGEDSITCGCNHLSLFSSGEGVEGGGFVPKSNIKQTVDINALSSINAKSAIGFYFVSIVLILYLFLGIIAWNKDSKDIKSFIDKFNEINVRQIMDNQIVYADSEESHNSLDNDSQTVENTNRTPRLAKYLKEKAEET